MKARILCDAGHFSKQNRSNVYKNYYEGDAMWSLMQYFMAELEKYDIEVGSTKKTINGHPRNKDGGDDVYARGTLAAGWDALISFHSNACDDEKVNRIVVIPPISGAGDPLAKKLGAAVSEVMGIPNVQIHKRNNGAGRDYYGIIRGAAAVKTVCIIIEHSFHTNYAAAKWLYKKENLKKLAVAEAKVVAEHFGAAAAKTEKPSVGGQKLYRVRKTWDDAKSQLGAFLSIERAQECADKNPGYSVFDEDGKCVYAPHKKSVEQVAREVISGKWGVGVARKAALEKAGYDYAAVQQKVNELLRK